MKLFSKVSSKIHQIKNVEEVATEEFLLSQAAVEYACKGKRSNFGGVVMFVDRCQRVADFRRSVFSTIVA